MIPVANITLEDALLDNPNFRANIRLFEGQVFFIESWLQRSVTQFTEEWKRLNEVTSVLNKRAEVPLLSQGMLSSQYTIPAMKLVGDAFRTTLALKHQYITEVNDQVVKPLDDFLKTDLKEFKDAKKTFDKALEKYESTLAKYNGQSRQKEPSALREEAFQLYDTRKAYIQAAMACSMLCIKFQDSLDQLVLGTFLDLIATQHDYFSGNADHFGSMALQVLQLKTYMKGHKEASAVALQELEQNKERYTADAIEYWKPSRSLKCYSNVVSPPKSTIGHAAIGPALAAQIGGQVPLNTYINRPATISQFSSQTPTRPPIPTQLTLPNIQTLSSGHTKSSSYPALSEDQTVSENVPNSSSLSRANNTSLNSLPNSASGNSIASSNSPSLTNIANYELEDGTPTTKQGYLNIRIPQPKNRAPVWQRKYFFIQEGEFGFESVVSNPTVGSQVVQSERIAVLLCEVRYGTSANSLMTLSGGGNPSSGSQGLAMVQMERRFCFEVVCATQSYLLQAETEDDLMSWVNTFEAAKRDMLLQQNLPRPHEPEEPYSPMIPDSAQPQFSFSGEDLLDAARAKPNSEAENSRPTGSLGLGWAANVPGVSLLLGSIGNNTSSATTKAGSGTESSGNGADNTDKSTDQAGDSSEAKAGTEGSKPESQSSLSVSTSVPTLILPSKDGGPLPPVLDTEAQSMVRSRSGTEVTVNPDRPAGHSQQQSEIERLMTSALHLVPKATPLAVSEIPHYPMELVVRNRELHLRFHGTKVHSKEYVLHSWTSGYLDDSRPDKPIMIYGRIFLTQSGMYFYARGLSIETKRMYRFSTIRGIECEQKDISTEWRIETVDGVQHVFCQFTLADTEYQVLHLIWTNVHQSKDRLPVKDLFKRTMLITNKPKGSAGSGSLAATESNHLTNRDGKMTHSSEGDGDVTVESPKGAASGPASLDGDWKDEEEVFPSTLQVPSGPVPCNCPGHLEKIELDQNFPISAKTLNRLLFSENSPIWKEFHERRNNTIQSIGEWSDAGGHKARTVKFVMMVNNPLVKLNQTDCVEAHTCEVEEDHLRYSYTVKSNVLAMPYSDAFTPVLRYCITYVEKNECKLMCSSGIEWHKNPLVKAMIKGAIIKGTAETIRDITEIIQLHLEQRKVNGSDATPGATKNTASGSHSRSDSAKIMISLQGPDNDGASIIHDPQDEGNNSDFGAEKSKDGRRPGLRRHTVSTGAGSGGVIYSGARVKGNWPTGEPPSFIPIGSKASRTKLLGRPSRSSLTEQGSPVDSLTKQDTPSSATGLVGTIQHMIQGILRPKDDKERRLMSTRLLYFVLIVSSLINIWAAFNSQRMLNTTWQMKGHGLSGLRGPLRGYSEPLNRVLGQDRVDNSDQSWNARNIRVAARAVFLKDLEEQMLGGGELEGFDDEGTIDRSIFEIFLEVRDLFRTWPQPPLERFAEQNDSGASYPTSTTSLSPAATPRPTGTLYHDALDERRDAMERYPWLLPQHRRWATKIIFQRDRVGIMRHDLLVTFEVLKQLERRLLETEYVNWIMDERSRCRLWERRRKLQSSEKDTTADKGLGGEELLSPSSSEKTKKKNTFLNKLESEDLLDNEKVKQRLAHLDEQDEEEDEEGKLRKRQLLKVQVTNEFCAGLERQVELFMLDTSSSSSSPSRD
ncbi:SNF1-interacting protein [Linnemannia schmuckeri]|uniref:SNF1-interacting protein n=1 Tax=Linnemannia schmuckeri TaxID=64567 RepID=A0A9P5RZ52_9FUNG|nr:SNF1-interacting protein [Linnemannia schmuckeri]